MDNQDGIRDSPRLFDIGLTRKAVAAKLTSISRLAPHI